MTSPLGLPLATARELGITIPGATRTQQAAENAGAMRFRLSDAELVCLDDVSYSFR